MTGKDIVLNINGISVSYGKKRVLRNIYLEMTKGQIYGVVGPNGAGKSTLFKAILELIDTVSGEVKIFNSELNEVRKRIAYIPQKDEVDWDFPATVLDIAMMGRYPHKKLFQRMNKVDIEKTMAQLEYLGIQDLKDRQIGELSGGQQQRVFLARALVQEADLLLLDEPFVGIDATTEKRILEILHEQADMGKTFLVIHHNLDDVKEYFDQVILLNQRIVACGPVNDAFTPENIRSTYGSQSSIMHQTGMLGD